LRINKTKVYYEKVESLYCMHSLYATRNTHLTHRGNKRTKSDVTFFRGSVCIWRMPVRSLTRSREGQRDWGKPNYTWRVNMGLVTYNHQKGTSYGSTGRSNRYVHQVEGRKQV